ncbi:MAG: hypothetical protein WD598_00890 [Acidimicrobiia bacterium]
MPESTELHTESPEQLFHSLVELVDGILVARPKYVVIQKTPDRYVQALVDVDGALQVETVSNEFLESATQLNARNEARLDHMGWRPPSDHSPNWHHFCAPVALASAGRRATPRLRAAHGLQVRIRTTDPHLRHDGLHDARAPV